MPSKTLALKCAVATESTVALGPGKRDANKIVLTVSNESKDPIQFGGLGASGEFSLSASIGTGSADLFAPPSKDSNESEETAIKVSGPPNWEPKPYRNLAGRATWSFRLPGRPGTVLDANRQARITIATFESRTDPGPALITLRMAITGYDTYETLLEISKDSREFDLLHFTADPPYVITDRNAVTLEWNTVQAGQAILYSNNAVIETFRDGERGFASGKPFKYRDTPSMTTVYKLVATDKEDPRRQRTEQVTVQVLAPGWHKIAFPRYGNPSVLCSMDGVKKLFGIFVKNRAAKLYSSEHPLSGWTLEHDRIPEKMQTSPLVSFRNRLWLVGGSMADTDTGMRSNAVWCYKKDIAEWNPQKEVPWTARMGHACLVFNDRLWVLGGSDDYGQPRNDVWAADLKGDQLDWGPGPIKTHDEKKDWEPRCMFAATAFNGSIWIFGGANQPFGQPFENVWKSGDGKRWVPYEINPAEGQPLGCALQVIRNQLNLIGALKRGNSVVARKCVLSEGQRLWRSSEVPEASWLDQVDNTFSLVSVEYGGFVYLIWQDYKTYSSSGQLYLNVYLP